MRQVPQQLVLWNPFKQCRRELRVGQDKGTPRRSSNSRKCFQKVAQWNFWCGKSSFWIGFALWTESMRPCFDKSKAMMSLCRTPRWLKKVWTLGSSCTSSWLPTWEVLGVSLWEWELDKEWLQSLAAVASTFPSSHKPENYGTWSGNHPTSQFQLWENDGGPFASICRRRGDFNFAETCGWTHAKTPSVDNRRARAPPIASPKTCSSSTIATAGLGTVKASWRDFRISTSSSQGPICLGAFRLVAKDGVASKVTKAKVARKVKKAKVVARKARKEAIATKAKARTTLVDFVERQAIGAMNVLLIEDMSAMWATTSSRELHQLLLVVLVVEENLQHRRCLRRLHFPAVLQQWGRSGHIAWQPLLASCLIWNQQPVECLHSHLCWGECESAWRVHLDDEEHLDWDQGSTTMTRSMNGIVENMVMMFTMSGQCKKMVLSWSS